jgi:hypothetical protein
MASQQPTYRAYTVIKREGQDDYWLALGAAFMHQDGDGYNIVLQALPLPNPDGQCKIVLRPPNGDEKSGDDRAQGDQGNVQSPRAENNKSGSRRR